MISKILWRITRLFYRILDLDSMVQSLKRMHLLMSSFQKIIMPSGIKASTWIVPLSLVIQPFRVLQLGWISMK